MSLLGPHGSGRRVVITGLGARSPLGATADALWDGLRAGRSGVRRVPAWEAIEGIDSLVAGVVDGGAGRSIPRKQRRSMGRSSILAVLAARDALAQAGLDGATVRSGRVGVAVASTLGSAAATDAFCTEIDRSGSVRGLRSTAFLQFMGHSPAANVALACGAAGRMLSPTCACSSGTQAIGLAAEQIAAGLQDAMIAGGSEELHHTVAATFAAAQAASRGFNDRPDATPRPFDADRDGLVVGEGAGVVVLEAREHALARGAAVLAEVLGFATTADTTHMTQPDPDSMARCIQLALDDAGVAAADVGYVNAHATGTPQGDAAEAAACRALYGDGVPISSTKGHTGHALGAAGGLESVICVRALTDGWLPPTRNLERIGEGCGGLDLLTAPRDAAVERTVNQSFAFGGTAAVLIFGAHPL